MSRVAAAPMPPAAPADGSLAALAEALTPRVRAASRGNDGVAAVRDRAFAALDNGLSWPGPRAAAWRHTPLGALPTTAWRSEANAGTQSLSDDALHAALAALPSCAARLVFVGGALVPAVSRLPRNAPGGPWLGNLRDIASRCPAALPHLGALDLHQSEAFAALNTTQLQNGALVYVPANGELHEVQLVFVATASAAPAYAAPRALVVLERAATAQVTEFHLNASATQSPQNRFDNPVTELWLDDGARLAYGVLQAAGENDVHVASIGARLGRDAHLGLHTFDEGAKLCHRSLHVRLEAPGAEVTLGHVALAGAGQHQATQAVVRHGAANTHSHQVFKTAVQARGTAAFGGTVDIAEGAPGAAAKQMSRALLLQDGAQAFLQPQLQICTDDVRCAHGATVGELDREALFYLMSRGLAENEARQLLTLAFLDDALRAAPPALRPSFVRRTGAWLGAPDVEALATASETLPEALS